MEETARVDKVLRYHDLSSHHHPSRLAKGGTMDWAQQPAKFLKFKGAPMLDLHDYGDAACLPPVDAGRSAAMHPSLLQLFQRRSSATALRMAPPSARGGGEGSWLARVLQEGLGLTAWKGQGTALWTLRANASSGALQPLEAYVLADSRGVPEWTGTTAALFHYNPFWHALEVLCELPAPSWAALREQLPSGGALIAVTAFYWRNAWKYGDPGLRYVHQDAGHYIGADGVARARHG